MYAVPVQRCNYGLAVSCFQFEFCVIAGKGIAERPMGDFLQGGGLAIVILYSAGVALAGKLPDTVDPDFAGAVLRGVGDIPDALDALLCTDGRTRYSPANRSAELSAERAADLLDNSALYAFAGILQRSLPEIRTSGRLGRRAAGKLYAAACGRNGRAGACGRRYNRGGLRCICTIGRRSFRVCSVCVGRFRCSAFKRLRFGITALACRKQECCCNCTRYETC
jgi:hypothetical protein